MTTNGKRPTRRATKKTVARKRTAASSGTGAGTAARAQQRSTQEQLAEYRRKRDFGKTAEPAGGASAQAARSQLQFVVQKHAASHLHYDLRLELDGVMKSWAVPRGPSLDPATKRLAMQVEDHPVEYNTFEGTIPKGEYGGGTVMLWDRGTYSPDEMATGETPAAAVRRGLRAGKLAFTFHGERLRGSYALVRTQREPRPKWLLIKHRDAEATTAFDITEKVRTSVETGRTMEEIAGESDRVWRSNREGRPGGEERRAGESVAATADVLVPMRPKPTRTLPETGDWSYEPWRGGERVLAYAAADAARIFDSGGRDITRRYRHLAAELSDLAVRVGHAFVAEAELWQPDGAAELFLSDLLVNGTETLVDRPWRERRDALAALLRRRRLQNLNRQLHEEAATSLLRRAAREGWAGIVARKLNGRYRPGIRSDDLLRIAAR